MTEKEPPRRKRFTGRMWGAMWQGYYLPGYFVFRTRKEAWEAILKDLNGHHDKNGSSHETKDQLKARGWNVCRIDATLKLVDSLPTAKQIDKWKRNWLGKLYRADKP